MPQRIPFTEKRAKDIAPPAIGRLVVYDEGVPQLALAVTAAGVRTWYVIRKVGGRVAWVSLGRWPGVPVLTARELARAALVQQAQGVDVIAERRAAEQKRQGGTVPMLVAAERLLAKLRERNRSARHVHEIDRISHQAHDAGVVDLADPGVAAKAEKWLDSLEISAQTRNRWRRHLIAIGKSAVRWWPADVLPREPFLPLGGVGAPMPAPPTFTPAEAVTLSSDRALEQVDNGGPLWWWLLSTGCRLSEGCWARWDRIDLGRRTYTVIPPTPEEKANGYSVKRDKLRTLELYPEVVEVLQSWKASASGDYLFPNKWRSASSAGLMRAFRAHLVALGIPLESRRIHCLRHTNACLALAAGVDGLRLQLSLGHAGQEMTRHYAAASMRWRGLLAGWDGALRLRDPVEVARLAGEA